MADILEGQPKFDIGIVGDGQLGRMLTEAAIPMGFSVGVMGPASDGTSPAAQVGAAQAIKAPIDSHDGALYLARLSEVTTIEVEHINVAGLAAAQKEDHLVLPSPDALAKIQDKVTQKDLVASLGIPVAPYAAFENMQDAIRFFNRSGGKIVLKQRVGGYDGRGNRTATDESEVLEGWDELKGKGLYGEMFIPVEREVALQVARSTTGEIASYDLVESVQAHHICNDVYTSDELSDKLRADAKMYAEAIMQELGIVGVAGFEWFVTEGGNLMFNEMAPRVHNSGHHTQDSAETSQFENHIRAITGQELGSPDLKFPHAAMANILYAIDKSRLDDVSGIPGVNVHMYGKEPKKGSPRKIGHVNTWGNDQSSTLQLARDVRDHLLVK